MKRDTKNNYGKTVGIDGDSPRQNRLCVPPTQEECGMQIGFCIRGLSSNTASITSGLWAL